MPDAASRQNRFIAKAIGDSVSKLARAHHLNADPVGMDRQQLVDLATGVGDDLTVGIASERQVALKHLPPLEWVLIAVRPPAQKLV